MSRPTVARVPEYLGCYKHLFSFFFLVACYANLWPAMSVGRSVCRSVALSFFGVFGCLLQYCSCPNAWVSMFHHCPCPPARDFGSRVSGLVFIHSTIFLSSSSLFTHSLLHSLIHSSTLLFFKRSFIWPFSSCKTISHLGKSFFFVVIAGAGAVLGNEMTDAMIFALKIWITQLAIIKKTAIVAETKSKKKNNLLMFRFRTFSLSVEQRTVLSHSLIILQPLPSPEFRIVILMSCSGHCDWGLQYLQNRPWSFSLKIMNLHRKWKTGKPENISS